LKPETEAPELGQALPDHPSQSIRRCPQTEPAAARAVPVSCAQVAHRVFASAQALLQVVPRVRVGPGAPWLSSDRWHVLLDDVVPGLAVPAPVQNAWIVFGLRHNGPKSSSPARSRLYQLHWPAPRGSIELP